MTYTPVQNRFWSDGWVRQLNALDRYLFLYLLTNGRAKLTGIYELPLDLMASESGIDEKDLRLSMLQRLEPKIYYKEGWIIITNYLRYHVGGGHKFNQGIKANFEELPNKIQALAKDCGYPIDTLSIPYSHFPTRIEYNKRNTVTDVPVLLVEEEDQDHPVKRREKDGFEDGYLELCTWGAKRRGGDFLELGPQFAALKRARTKNIGPHKLKERWKELEGQSFYQENGIDWKSVVSSFNRKP